MKKILVCQHVAYEILGTLNPLFKDNGFRIRYVNFSRHPDLKPTLENYQGLVILGGPMNLGQTDTYRHLLHEIEMIEYAMEKGIPTLGICLGAQLIAKALGAEVGSNREKEIGWYDVSLTKEGKKDPIFSHFDGTEKIFQWHGDTFKIPQGAVHLASSPSCANQAFRFGDSVYGFQFHLEVDEPMIARWLEVPLHLNELDKLKGKIDPENIRQETPLYIDRLKDLSRKTFTEFIKLIGTTKKFRQLPSR